MGTALVGISPYCLIKIISEFTTEILINHFQSVLHTKTTTTPTYKIFANRDMTVNRSNKEDPSSTKIVSIVFHIHE